MSQAVSGEIVLEKLIDTLMRTAFEQAGAERGLLILPRGVEQRIKAEAKTGGEILDVQLRDRPVTSAVLPESVLYYVLRTRAMREESMFSVSATMSMELCASQSDSDTSSNRSALKTSM